MNEVVYSVKIPKSNTAHQANDKKYYKRFNFNSEPMYDYEIRDILNRTKNPLIDLELEIVKRTWEVKKQSYELPPITLGFNTDGTMGHQKLKPEFKTKYTLKIYARNNGKVLANYLNSYVYLPDSLLKNPESAKDGIASLFMENTIRDIVDTEFLPSFNGSNAIHKYGPSRYDPILPSRCLFLKSVVLNESILESNESLNWIVFTDNAEPRKGQVKVKEIEIVTEQH